MSTALGHFGDVAIVALAIGIPFGFAALVVYFKHQQRLAREQTIRIALEKGPNLSPEITRMLEESLQSRDRSRHGGVFTAFLFIGLASAAYFSQFNPQEGGAALLGCMAVGYAVTAFLNAREPKAK